MVAHANKQTGHMKGEVIPTIADYVEVGSYCKATPTSWLNHQLGRPPTKQPPKIANEDVILNQQPANKQVLIYN